MSLMQPAVVLPDHILAAVLTIAKRESKAERLAFRGHDFYLQEIFSKMSGRYSVLKPFVFSDNGPEPYSPALSESVSRLQLSGIIGRENPDYEIVFLRPAADRFYDEVLSSEFDAAQMRELTEIASEFLSHVDLA